MKSHIPRRNTVFARASTAVLTVGICVAALVAAQPAQAAGVHAGTVIRNTATATFSSDGATTTTLTSNTVSLRVDEVIDVAVAPVGAPETTVAAGATSQVLTFTLTNAGNGPEAFKLTGNAAIGGDDFDPAIDAVAVDTNGNGLYDPGIDAIVAAGASAPTIDPDGSLTIFVLTTVGATVADGARGRIGLTATSATGSGAAGTVLAGLGSGGGDAVVGATGAISEATTTLVVRQATVAFVKSATVTDPFGGTRVVPGAIVTYRLVATISGSGTISGLRVIDAIPEGTSYVPASLTLAGAPLSDAADADAGRASPAGIDVLIGTAAAGSSRDVTFKVKVN